MTQFLASVRDAMEAEIALAGGADIIDFKDPDHGALGALDSTTIEDGVRAVAKRKPTSATAGDWPLDPEVLVAAARRIGETGVDFVKLGLLPGPECEPCIEALREVTRHYRLVVVLFADRGVTMSMIHQIAVAGCTGVLIDTFDKANGRLRNHLPDSFLREFVALAREKRMFAGLAGSLRLEDIEPLISLQPDILGFRGALCDSHKRTQGIAVTSVEDVRDEIDRVRSLEHRAGGTALFTY